MPSPATPDRAQQRGRPVLGAANGPLEDNHLHTNPYPNTAAPGQTRECEAGNEHYPDTRRQTIIGNPPGNQGTVTQDQPRRRRARREARARTRMTAFHRRPIALVLILVRAFLGFTKDIPFTRPFELNAVFQNAPPIQPTRPSGSPASRWARSRTSRPLSGDSPGVKVTMKLEDDALPIHEDAQVEVRERIFLEGNLFLDLKPGSPSAPELDDGGTIPVSQTVRAGPARPGARHAPDRTPARTCRTCSSATARRSTASRRPARTPTRIPTSRARPPAQALNESLDYAPRPCAARRSSTRPRSAPSCTTCRS